MHVKNKHKNTFQSINVQQRTINQTNKIIAKPTKRANKHANYQNHYTYPTISLVVVSNVSYILSELPEDLQNYQFTKSHAVFFYIVAKRNSKNHITTS